MKKPLLTYFALGLMAVSAHAATNLLVDGDFSNVAQLGSTAPTPLGNSYQYTNVWTTGVGGVGGWNFSSVDSPLNNNAAVYLVNTKLSYPELWIPQASADNTNGYVVQLDSTTQDNQGWTIGNSISQTVNLAAGNYELTFSINTEHNNGLDKSGTSAADLELNFSTSGAAVTDLDGGTPTVLGTGDNGYKYTVSSTQPDDGTATTWQTYTVDFSTSAPGDVDILFADDVMSDNSNISLEDLELFAIPEPSTWALLLGGFGLLSIWRLRSRKA